MRIAALAFALLAAALPARADTVEVMFTGHVYFTFDAQFGGPSYHGIAIGNLFSAQLTYDPSQPNLSSTANEGLYENYDFAVTVQTGGGPVSFDAPCNGCGAPIAVGTNMNIGVVNQTSATADLEGFVNNAGSSVAFTFQDYTNTSLSDDLLTDINWQNLLTQSQQAPDPNVLVRAPDAAVVPEGNIGAQPSIFLRAPNAAVVVIGSIDNVGVQQITTPTPEPSTLLLFATAGIALLSSNRKQKKSRS
jgi:hypothetical protein